MILLMKEMKGKKERDWMRGITKKALSFTDSNVPYEYLFFSRFRLIPLTLL